MPHSWTEHSVAEITLTSFNRIGQSCDTLTALLNKPQTKQTEKYVVRFEVLTVV
jgi:hypothetical protein